MTAGTIIRHASVLTPDGVAEHDVAIADGRIVALLARGDGDAALVIDATDLTLIPGAIDIHCHVRAPAFSERGTVESETRAAAAGGVTTLFEMPITRPCCNSAERVALRREHFAQYALVNFGLYAAPGDLSERGLQQMRDEGVIAFKIFTTAAPAGRDDEFEGLCYPEESQQLEVLTALARTGLPVVVHAESADLLARAEAAARKLDPALATTHNAARPAICEAIAVAKLLTMNIEARARLHIAHVSSALTVDVLRRFAGTSDFSAETCPHYLLRTVDDVQRVGVFGKVNPPVRERLDQVALWSAIADGTIRHVTTDHAAFTLNEKQSAARDFFAAPPGVPGLEVLLPMMLDATIQGRITLAQMTDLISSNAAQRFGLAPAKGSIVVGADADLVLVDLAATTEITAAALFTEARAVAALYDGARFQGRVVTTLVGGRVVYDHGVVIGDAVTGRFVSSAAAHRGRAA